MEPHQQKHALVLNAGYEVLGVIPWETAVSMWSTSKCEVLEEYDDVVRSAYLTIKIPAVVRLLEPVRKRRKQVKFSRINVYARDGYRCQYCGDHCKTSELTYDHVIPRAQGGKTEWNNIVSCCVPCNSKKASKTPTQAHMKLLKAPVQPVTVPQVSFEFTQKHIPEMWRDYIYWAGGLDA